MVALPDQSKEDVDFNQQFDFLYRSLRQRLTSFTTIESCGLWNTLVLDDLRTDVELRAYRVSAIAVNSGFS